MYSLLTLALVVLIDMLLLPAKWQIRAQRIVPANVGLGDRERGEYRVKSTAFPRFPLLALRLAPADH